MLALAKTDEEAQTLRNQIKQAVSNPEYAGITIIDALSTPLGLEEFEKYVDYSAMSMYYNGNQNQQAKDNAKKAKDVLDRTWRDRIHDGQFIVWSYANQDGEKASGANSVHTILQATVLNRFKFAFDFTKGLTESQLKLTQANKVSRYGIGDLEVKGLIAGCEKTVLGKVWHRSEYWIDADLDKEPISIIKRSLKVLMDNAFGKNGRISIDEIYDFLETTYGFAPSNLSAFIVGFLLSEYGSDPYRYMDAEGHRDSMSPDKLAEMIGNCMSKKAKPTYIVSLTDEEKAFYELTEAAWGIKPNTCSSPTQAGALVQNKMRDLVFPVWCLEDVDNHGVFDIVKKYISLVQCSGDDAHTVANEIGKIALNKPSCADNLRELLTADNCLKGMQLFLEHFEGGKLLDLAISINATHQLIPDIKKLFSVKHSAQWVVATGEDEIRKLMVEYETIKITNLLLNVSTSNRDSAFKAWRESLKFIGISCESVQTKYPMLDKLFAILLKIANMDDLLADSMKLFLDELTLHNTEMRDILSDTLTVFIDLYAPYLDGFDRSECESIKNSITVATDMFVLSSTKSNATVKKAAEDYRKNQIKVQLFGLWSEKTNGSKNPKDWSDKYRTPILCCVHPSIYSEAKKAFSILNSATQSEAEIKFAMAFLQNASFFDDLADAAYRDRCFMNRIMGGYAQLLPDINSIRSTLESLLIDPYDWIDDPRVANKIRSIAQAEYNAGGSDKVISMIDSMPPDALRSWLKNLASSDMELGVKIITNGGK